MSMKELSMDRICRKSYNERDLYTIRGKGMTLQQLKYLVTVAECGSISEAAQKLFISQPSLSAAIQNLEKEMGVTAFSRSSKGVVITREGEELLAYSRMLLEQAGIWQGQKPDAEIFGVVPALFLCGQCVCGFGETVRCQPVQFYFARDADRRDY